MIAETASIALLPTEGDRSELIKTLIKTLPAFVPSSVLQSGSKRRSPSAKEQALIS